jgi:hypothetical protein
MDSEATISTITMQVLEALEATTSITIMLVDSETTLTITMLENKKIKKSKN